MAKVGDSAPPSRVGLSVPPGSQHPTIRPANSKNLDDLQALARHTIDSCYRDFLGDEAVDSFIDSGASDAHVKSQLARGGVHCLTRDRRIIGFSILEGPTIDLMMVDPNHQRRGLGRILLQHAETALLTQYSTIRLESFEDNTGANSFYAACGWSHAGPLEAEEPAKVEYIKNDPYR